MKQILSGIIIVIFISSCTMKSLYNYSDFFLIRYVNSRVNLDEPLYSEVKASSRRLLDWHRTTQLLTYAQWIDNVKRSTQKKVTHAQVSKYFQEADEMLYSAMQKLFQELALLMPSMKSSEVEELFESLQYDNQVFYDKYVSITPTTRIDQYSENMLDGFEEIMGRLTPVQHEVVKKAGAELFHTSKERYIQRLSFQRSLYTILSSDQSRDNKQKQLASAFQLNYKQSMNDNKQLHNRSIIINTIVSVLNHANDKQRLEMNNNFSEFHQMLSDLYLQ